MKTEFMEIANRNYNEIQEELSTEEREERFMNRILAVTGAAVCVWFAAVMVFFVATALN